MTSYLQSLLLFTILIFMCVFKTIALFDKQQEMKFVTSKKQLINDQPNFSN